ncbi:MAG TPA: type II toxin-antitoxin system RelE/ParE family toxin [Ktedonobacteraceae bacterium]|nr:type II toxin-antitoxin system RelE/ParE family toxin [Ktedonobacteraceae bacterium]
MNRWQIQIAMGAQLHLSTITDKRIQRQISERIDRLQYDPDKQGKPLQDELEDYRSVRAVRKHYRIIYKVEEEQIVVIVVTVGIRKEGDKKDAYNLAKKLARLNLLNQIVPENSHNSDITENSRGSDTVAASL